MASEVITLPLGVGELYATDNAAVPQSYYFGGLQELALKYTRTTKGFKGAYRHDLVRAIVGEEATISAKYGAFKADLIGSLLGGVVSTGHRRLIQAESTGVIAGATYTAANVTGFEQKGVCNELGVPMTRVASAPASGQFSVTSGGVYTFNTDANGKVYTVRYTYSVPSTGKSAVLSNQLIAVPTLWYQIDSFNPEDKTGYVFPKALPKTFDLPRKNDDFIIQGIEFDVMPDASQVLGTIYQGP